MSHFKQEYETLIAPGFKPLIINYENKEKLSTTNKNQKRINLETRVFLHRPFLKIMRTKQNQLRNKE